jgi:flagellar basal-body rod protein FlgC
MDLKGILSSFQNSVRGMRSQTRRLELVSNNIANADKVAKPGEEVYRKKKLVTREFEPYQRKIRDSVISVKKSNNRHIDRSQRIDNKRQAENYTIIEEEKTQMVYDPAHPYADENGYIRKPDINVVEEMVDLMSLSRTYEANVKTFNSAKELAKKSLDI